MTLVPASSSRSSGGGSVPSTHAWYGLNVPQSIAGGGSKVHLGLDTLFAGDALLDISDPANPTIVTAGVYAFSATVVDDPANPDDPDHHGIMLVNIDMSGFGFYAGQKFQLSEPGLGGIDPDHSASVTGYCPAGGLCPVIVAQDSGVARVFACDLLIQRLA